MYPLLESLKLLDGQFYNIEYHNRRMNHTRKMLFGINTPIHLEGHLNVPEYARHGLFKCRLVYSRFIERVEYIPYKTPTIRTLKIVHHDQIAYPYKYVDRREIDMLFAQRESCDDILIIKNRRVTDTSYGNVLFYDGRQWCTPLYPLLEGTQRQKLLEEKLITAAEILEQDIRRFSHFKVINALNDFNAFPPLPVQCLLKVSL